MIAIISLILFKELPPRNTRAFYLIYQCIYIQYGLPSLTKGVHLDFLLNLFSEIAVAQQTRVSDQAFKGSWTQPPTGACGAATPIFNPILA